MSRLPKNCHLWLPGMVKSRFRHDRKPGSVVHVYVCMADHFEPGVGRAPLEVQRQRVDAWVREYPAIAARHRDSDGRPPQHTFFFPAEEYVPEHLDQLANLCRAGWGDVEVHLHHDRDTASHLRETLLSFTHALYNRHGLLRRDENGAIAYGFIHGNWALNNSRPDGRWCGVDDETTVLLETGCYADFTMPSVPSPTQSRMVNSVYYVQPQNRPRAHDHGLPARSGMSAPPGLLMIQGPLCLDWRNRRWGILPGIETGEIDSHRPPVVGRVALWLQYPIHVLDAPEHIFIKLFTHGAHSRNVDALLERRYLDVLWNQLEEFCSASRGYQLHYVTAYELALSVRRIETEEAVRIHEHAGRPGSPV